MKVGIAGAGVAGSYLAHKLSNDNEVVVFDKREKKELGNHCAWGTSRRTLKKYTEELGLEPSKYLLKSEKKFITNFFVNRDTITFDKNQFLTDILESGKFETKFQEKVTRYKLKDFDLIIDATGAERDILPESKNELNSNWYIPCFQLLVESESLPNDFYFEIKGSGYLWVFPLNGNKYRVGCGAFDKNPRAETENFLEGKDHEILSRDGSMIRLIPPSKSRPFFVNTDPPVIGVGESIGIVSPLTGEGITHALKGANILLNNLQLDKIKKESLYYEKDILEEFDWIDSQWNFMLSLRFRNKIDTFFKLLQLPIPDSFSGDILKHRIVLDAFSLNNSSLLFLI